MMQDDGEERSARAESLLDGFAVCASFTCMAHCLLLPLLLAALPAFADRLDPGESFHLIVLLLAIPTSAFALVAGWRRHRASVPLAVGSAGLVLMAAGIAFASREAIETGLTVAGSLLLAGAHIANWRNRGQRPAVAAVAERCSDPA
ncbi:MerC domain-containing protein [Rhizorhabdus sp. FW153]|uniref:MerC domain-containing protein n=1 Tax=Rhizorhabdus sp. FW153 TaxID=3400216 RepID=UPI003CF22A81